MIINRGRMKIRSFLNFISFLARDLWIASFPAPCLHRYAKHCGLVTVAAQLRICTLFLKHNLGKNMQLIWIFVNGRLSIDYSQTISYNSWMGFKEVATLITVSGLVAGCSRMVSRPDGTPTSLPKNVPTATHVPEIICKENSGSMFDRIALDNSVAPLGQTVELRADIDPTKTVYDLILKENCDVEATLQKGYGVEVQPGSSIELRSPMIPASNGKNYILVQDEAGYEFLVAEDALDWDSLKAPEK